MKMQESAEGYVMFLKDVCSTEQNTYHCVSKNTNCQAWSAPVVFHLLLIFSILLEIFILLIFIVFNILIS